MNLTPEQEELAEACREKAGAIAEHRHQISLLAAERRVLAEQLLSLIGDLSTTAQVLDVSRQTLAGIVGSARRPSGPSLLPLVQAGVLSPNEPLIINRRNRRSLEAQVRPDGSIQVGTDENVRVFASPSAAAGYLLSVRSADGWLRFRCPERDWRTLHELRESLGRQGAVANAKSAP